jgi:hypothetical protein
MVPQRLKPDSLQSMYVRPDARCGEVGRTLQKHESFRKLISRVVQYATGEGAGCGKTPVFEGYGLPRRSEHQAVRTCFAMNSALAAEGTRAYLSNGTLLTAVFFQPLQFFPYFDVPVPWILLQGMPFIGKDQ